MHSAEEATVKAFIESTRQARWLEGLASAKRRQKILGRLNHCHDIDMRFTQEIPKNKRALDGILEVLQEKGAPTTCFVMSTDVALDNREMDLGEALEQVVNSDRGTLISCISGKLAYFEGESFERYILERHE